MRLTLRTLLAYRDGVLGPSDMEDLHRRIQSSHDVGNLLRRIGTVTKLNEVLAPPLFDKGLGGDPNSIAEYLDDSLQHSQVPELERICLVSDAQLAELADCHTLLSTAMSTKVTVSPDVRRMALAVVDPHARQQIADELESRKAPRRKRRDSEPLVRSEAVQAQSNLVPAVPVPVVVASPMLASGGESIKPQGLNLETTALAHEVPEYLVGSPSGNWKMPLAIVGLLALLSLVVWQALGPWEQVAELFAAKGSPRGSSSQPIDYDLITESEQTPPGIPATSPAAGSGESPPQAEIESETSAPPGVPAVVEIDTDSQGPPGLDPAASAQPDVQPPSPQPDQAEPAVSAEGPPGLPPTTAVPAAEPSAPVPNATRAIGAALWLPEDGAASSAVILVRQGNELVRVAPNQPLQVPVSLIVPPSMRTTIDLPGGALWTVCGPSQLTLDKQDAANASAADDAMLQPKVTTGLCRGLVRSGPDGRHVVVATPVGNYQIELTDPNSLASVEVSYRQVGPGAITDPQVTRPVLVIIAAEGTAIITPLEPAGQSQLLKLGDGFAVVADEKPQKFRLQNIPAWFRSSVDRPIDGLAADDLNRLLAAPTDPAQGVGPDLRQLSSARRPETAALATQLLLLCGEWEPLVSDFFSNDRLRNHWTPTLQLTRQLIASDAAAAERLQQLLIDAHDTSGQLLYELICGPSAEQLQGDALAQLVSQLENVRLDVRVLAAYQLQLLTGKNLGFQPASPNRASVQQWRRDLATNRVSLLDPGPAIWESVPR